MRKENTSPMPTVPVLFNRQPLIQAGKIEQPPDNEIKNTFGLWNCSLDDAVRYGGEITRQAIQAMNLRHDRKNIIVDTKIHMLMKGMSPAIPGIHCDGAPRDEHNNPQGKGLPDTLKQEKLSDRSNRYHILITGTGCLTQFVSRPITLQIPSEPSEDVYNIISKQVRSMSEKDPTLLQDIPTCTVVQFDWFDLHTGVIASKKEWRYLIRVCESDFYEPQKDLRNVIRIQSQVYSPYDFGW
jgi:hypothetical protein